jgi:hypothetical protein
MATKKQRFTTLTHPSGNRIAVDLEKVETAKFSQPVPGMPEYSPHLVLQLSGREIWVSEDDAERVLEILGIELAELEEMERVV